MNRERIFKVLLAPHVSEKAMADGAGNKVVFKVATDATKAEIKVAVEQLFRVAVNEVRVVNVKGKIRRTRHGVGQRSDWKKAYVSLAEGQEIDLGIAG